MRQTTCWFFCLSAITLSAPALAQLAPGGFTGVINSPSADVLSPGTASAALSNSNPEKRRDYPGLGSFGSANLGFGVLPGLEIVGRLAFDGDPNCNMYAPGCQSSLRDLSAGVKFQLPLRLDWNTRLAFGATDIGGAATNFRSYYGVATSTLGAFDVSLGYGRGGYAHSSLDGVFGSTQLFLTDHWQVMAEYDSRELRAGVRYARPLTEQLALELGASRKLTSRTDQQAWQAGLGLTFSFDKHALNEGTRKLSLSGSAQAVAGTTTAAVTVAAEPPLALAPAQVAPSAPALPAAVASAVPDSEMVATQARRAEQLASRLQSAGFTSVWIGFDDAQGWVVLAEPLLWRKNRLDALGMALAVWQKSASPNERVRLTLSYLQDPVLTVGATATCLAKFAEGGWWCDGRAALTLENSQSVRTPELGWAVAPANRQRWEGLRPQFEVGPVLRQHAGTEVGLYDASVGLDLAWEVQLGRGLLWQGQVTVPVMNTDNFASDKTYGAERIQSRLESSHISYQQQIAPRLWAQASLGYVQHNDYGGEIDLAWLSPVGGLRLSAMGGYYVGRDISGLTSDNLSHPMALGGARWSVIDGRWMLEAQAGQFYNQDYGIKLASHHWFGDNRLTLHYRNTQFSSPLNTRRLQFAGFQISMPIGPRAATPVGPATLRGSDQWIYGFDTKVGGSDNYVNNGYGVVPALRHGLLSDTLDNDRAGLSDVLANLYRVRAMLREMADKP